MQVELTPRTYASHNISSTSWDKFSMPLYKLEITLYSALCFTRLFSMRRVTLGDTPVSGSGYAQHLTSMLLLQSAIKTDHSTLTC